MILNKEQFNKLKNIINKLLINGGNVNKVSDIKLGDKIYIFPNCKIKRLDLRKWIKDKNYSQTYNVSDADVCIVQNDFISDIHYEAPITLEEGYLIPKGTYYYKHDPTIECIYLEEDTIMNGYELRWFINDVFIKSNNYYQNVTSGLQWTNALSQFEFRAQAISNIVKIEDKHILKLTDPDLKIINELDAQQVLYDWEVENNIRDSTEEYNWESLKSLIISGEHSLVITMIEKMNVEPILSKLLGCYYSKKVSWEFKKEIYKRIFSRNPKLINAIDHYNMYFMSIGFKKTQILDLIDVCKNIDIELNIDDFTWR